MLHGAFTIAQEEGIKGLYKGLPPALLRQAVYASLRVGLYGTVKNIIQGDDPAAVVPFWKKVLAGATCGSIGAFIANPTDLVKVRMQAEAKLPPGTPPRYKGTLDAFRKVVQQEGVLGLWKGATPATQRAAIVNGVELATYDHAKFLLVHHHIVNEGVLSHFCASFIAGFFSTVFSNPIDVVKTRLMSQPFGPDGKGLKYSSVLDCFAKTIKTEGPLALYKGFIPNFSRIGSWNIVAWVTLEQLKGYYHKNIAPPTQKL